MTELERRALRKRWREKTKTYRAQMKEQREQTDKLAEYISPIV